MVAYEPLTKIETDKDGNEMAVCRFAGTSECRPIHKLEQIEQKLPLQGDTK